MSHLHLPIQSGSDRVLALMKRGYTVLEYKSVINKLKKARPNITFSSDFIVGFPGETEEDFLKTIDIIREVNFDHSYSFIYSKRPGTPAASIIDNVTSDEKKERLAFLKKTIDDLSKNKSQSIIGEETEILVEGKSSKYKNMVTGRTTNNKIINVLGDKKLIGKILNVKVRQLENKTLLGEIL